MHIFSKRFVALIFKNIELRVQIVGSIFSSSVTEKEKERERELSLYLVIKLVLKIIHNFITKCFHLYS